MMVVSLRNDDWDQFRGLPLGRYVTIPDQIQVCNMISLDLHMCCSMAAPMKMAQGPGIWIQYHYRICFP